MRRRVHKKDIVLPEIWLLLSLMDDGWWMAFLELLLPTVKTKQFGVESGSDRCGMIHFLDQKPLHCCPCNTPRAFLNLPHPPALLQTSQPNHQGEFHVVLFSSWGKTTQSTKRNSRALPPKNCFYVYDTPCFSWPWTSKLQMNTGTLHFLKKNLQI